MEGHAKRVAEFMSKQAVFIPLICRRKVLKLTNYEKKADVIVTLIHCQYGNASKAPIATDIVLLGSRGAGCATVVAHQHPDINVRVFRELRYGLLEAECPGEIIVLVCFQADISSISINVGIC